MKNTDGYIKIKFEAKKECKDVVVIACGMLAAEIIALLLIDRLWRKKEHQQIKKLKEDIARREARLSKR